MPLLRNAALTAVRADGIALILFTSVAERMETVACNMLVCGVIYL